MVYRSRIYGSQGFVVDVCFSLCLIANLVVCGHPFFERCIRRAVSRAKHSITLFGSTFQPDETYASKTCWDRFVPGPADQRTRLQKANV